MAGERNQSQFEQATSSFQTIVGLTAVKSVDVLQAVATIEESGAQYLRQNPRELGHVAGWMVYALDMSGRLDMDGKVEPPLTDAEKANLQSKRDTYQKFLSLGETDDAQDDTEQPERTADRKA